MTPRNHNRRSAGFTLVEIIVTVMIMGMMLAGIARLLTSVRMSRDMVHNRQEQQLVGPAILDIIERDLRGIFTTSLPTTSHLRVTDDVMTGIDADRLDFVTTTDSLMWVGEGERQVRADLCEVGYCLRPNALLSGEFLELYRREGFGIDDDWTQSGRYVLLTDRVTNFNIEVFLEDGPDSDILDEWDPENSFDEEQQGLPASLKISLKLELEPRLIRETQAHMRWKREFNYTRIIRLPQSLRLAQADIPRYAIPTPQELPAEEVGDGTGDLGEEGEDGDTLAGGGRGGDRGGRRGGDDDGKVIEGSRTDQGGGDDDQ